ncbi:DUF1440 domain-containing protein [Pseudarthrobacter sp. NamE5]|uniref:DUF1440 domain-containing protein n=1 Tax=Pseudarthrobacter sp. NamE5 TaxID=2576839 RepID=UPI00110A2D57|nr:DUF1440 domain-containing protein [Pseudarthrobacter sp. NamE5]TLM88211.1 DUF1440 domain-containing protein [Pseudarthrobacter sp. NamE5]
MTHPTTTRDFPEGRTTSPQPAGNRQTQASPVPAPARPVEQPPRSVALDMLLGAVAGAVGVWAMDRVGWFLYNHEAKDAVARELQARQGGDDVEYTDAEQEALDRQPQAQSAGKDVAHVGAEKIAAMTGINVHTGQPNPSGVALHYALGILPGALHAVIRRQVPMMQAGGGALYGLGLFVVNDEVVAPALGLASGPTEYPWQAHARGAVAHMVLGVVTESVLQLFDRVR